MATSSKKGSKKSKPKKGKANLSQYVELRTFLDSLQIGALRYYLDAKSAEERTQRFNELKSELLPIIRQVWGLDEGLIIDCPEGYVECDGVCVPYQCIGGVN